MSDPAGSISLAVMNLRTLVAASATFQTWTASTGAGAALLRTYSTALPPPLNKKTYTTAELAGLRPFALVDVDRSGGFTRRRAAEAAYVDAGRLMLYFEGAVPPNLANDPGEAERQFLNTIGQILDDMATLSGSGGTYLVVESMQVADGPHRADVNEASAEGDYHYVGILVEWGP